MEDDAQVTGKMNRASARALLVWGLVRLPLIVVLLYGFRATVSALHIFDGAELVVRVIDLLSVPVSRAILFFAVALVLGGLFILATRLRPVPRYGVQLSATIVVAVLVFALTETSLKYVVIPVLLAATNLLPDEMLQRWATNTRMAIAIGITEVLTIRRHVIWLAELSGLSEKALHSARIVGWVLTVVLLSASMVLLAKGDRLILLEQSIRLPATASVLMRDNINGLALNAETRRLYITGHGIEFIQSLNVDDLAAAPDVSPVSTGSAQGLYHDVGNNQLIVYNDKLKQLVFLDADTLGLKRTIDVPQLASGDPWIVHDPISDTIALVSEADIDDGVAFVLLDQKSGDVLDMRELDAGNLVKHPEKPWLYLSFFRRNPEILIYDMATREIVSRTDAPSRVDRILWVPSLNELLITSPITSEVVRLDADTLATKGTLKAPFGVRTLAHDPQRELLFAGSFVTGQITIIDLATSRPIGTVYLGPWLRSIELDALSGTAFVSSNGALYRWSYDEAR